MFDPIRKESNHLTHFTFLFNSVSPFCVRQAIKNLTDEGFHSRVRWEIEVIYVII
jgi:hypothetical protein